MRVPVRVEIYSRPGCHLCDDAKAVVERVQARYGFALQVIDIDDDPQLAATYGTEIPVIFINGYKAFKYSVDEAELDRKVRRLWTR
jgi:glutaredoxin